MSVLFADLVAFTTLSEGRDPDEVHDLLTDYFLRARSIIEKFGGTVDKFIGDAVMGVWGARRIREDDAERAVRAGLELISMVAALGDEHSVDQLQLRAGVNSGTTSVGPGGNDRGLVVGDIVNVAARLQQAARPSALYVGASTHEVTARSIVYESGEQLDLKGKTEPVEAWRAIRPMGRVGSREGLREFPFVGRVREMRLLKDLLEATTSEQRSRQVSITGEAGIGKSRLVAEFVNHIDGFAEPVFWHQGRSPSYGDGLPMWALAEMVRQRAGISDDDRAVGVEKLRVCLSRFVVDQLDRDWVESWLVGLIGLGSMPTGPGSEMFSAIRTFFQSVATHGTTVLAFEDLHWADPSLIEFVTELVERSTVSPILVISMARPEIVGRFSELGANHSLATSIGLAPLVDGDMTAMLKEFLPGVASALVGEIVRRASGFPLYAAEIVRMLTNSEALVEIDGTWQFDGDAEFMAIPDTLQAVTEARLDRLNPEIRDVLQDAAVLGVTCTRAGLEAISGRVDLDAALEELVKLEVLRREDDPRSPERGQYRFVQGVIQEVAYRRLHRSDRRTRHVAAAEYFRSFEDPELAGVIASHLQRAVHATPVGVDRDLLEQQALNALVDSAGRCAELHSDQLAMDLYDEAIAYSDDADDRAEWSLLAAQSAAGGGAVDRGLAYLLACDELFASRDNMSGLRRTATERSSLLNSWFSSSEALTAIEPYYLGLDSIESEIALAVAAETARSYALCQRIDQAVAVCDRAIPVAERLDLTSIAVELVITRATALAYAGRFLEGVSALRGVLDVCEKQGLLLSSRRAMNNLMVNVAKHSPQEVAVLTPRFLELCERIGGTKWINRACQYVAWVARDNGDWEAHAFWLDRADQPMSDPLWGHIIAYQRESNLAACGHEGSANRLLEMCDSLDNDDPLWHGLLNLYRAFSYEMLRQWDQVAKHALAAAPLYYEGVRTLARAAAFLGDAQLLDLAEAFVDQTTFGPLRTNTHALLAAVRTGIAGDQSSAAAAFGHLVANMQDVESPREMVAVHAVFARAVGVERAEGRAAAEFVSEWLERTGSYGYREAWSDALGPVERSVGI